jgi:hypothetical protein
LGRRKAAFFYAFFPSNRRSSEIRSLQNLQTAAFLSSFTNWNAAPGQLRRAAEKVGASATCDIWAFARMKEKT